MNNHEKANLCLGIWTGGFLANISLAEINICVSITAGCIACAAGLMKIYYLSRDKRDREDRNEAFDKQRNEENQETK